MGSRLCWRFVVGRLVYGTLVVFCAPFGSDVVEVVGGLKMVTVSGFWRGCTGFVYEQEERKKWII